MAFETFTNKGIQVTSGPMSLSISKDGFAYLNTDTSRALGETEHIVFLFDSDNGRLGFRPTEEGADGAYKLTRVGPGRSCTMRKVLQHYGFDIKAVQGKHLLIPAEDDANVYLIDLLDQYTPEALAAAEAEAALAIANTIDRTDEDGGSPPTTVADPTDDPDDGFAPSNEIVAPRTEEVAAPEQEPEPMPIPVPKRKPRAKAEPPVDNTASRAVPKPKDRKTSNKRQTVVA